jgi:methylated-DNA-[protein]-cysteine S-methyltransferase
MANTEQKQIAELEARLKGDGSLEATDWSARRDAFARRALERGLADVTFERHDSPLGRLVLGATDAGLVRVGLPVEDEDAVLAELASRVSPRVLAASRGPLRDVRAQLDDYFAGRRRAFDVALDWRLTAGFRRAVLEATARIPFGRTASYRDVAARAGSPGATRAAGSALATNPLPIVVPCHRVLPSSGGVGQYRGGVAAKETLLRLEGAL